jgi:hypothetical protein
MQFTRSCSLSKLAAPLLKTITNAFFIVGTMDKKNAALHRTSARMIGGTSFHYAP